MYSGSIIYYGNIGSHISYQITWWFDKKYDFNLLCLTQTGGKSQTNTDHFSLPTRYLNPLPPPGRHLTTDEDPAHSRQSLTLIDLFLNHEGKTKFHILTQKKVFDVDNETRYTKDWSSDYVRVNILKDMCDARFMERLLNLQWLWNWSNYGQSLRNWISIERALGAMSGVL